MRPIRLQMKGFTAFRDEQWVDFEDLDLFAIAGPTGSGKSSILDAMTYALFGQVERVGKQVGQLVSQGQPSMAVTLEFEVAGDRWRIGRRTPANGATKVLLERRDGDGEWRQAGDGADRVRDANGMVAKAIGIDYDAFTRSVLLPQGKFAEFLVGDARERRSILTEILGLELFERLAKRAGEIKKHARAQADAKFEVLEREYAGVTPEAMDATEESAAKAAADEASLASAEKAVRKIVARWASSEREVRELRALADEATSMAATASAAAAALGELAEALVPAEENAKDAASAAEKAAAAVDAAAKARAGAEKATGGMAELGRRREKAEQIAGRETALAGAEDDVETTETKAIPAAERALAEREEDLARARSAALEAASAVESARDGLDGALHADVVATVRAGLKVGDPCPVCGEAITVLPKGRATVAAASAKKALAAAEKKAAAAAKTAAARERDLAEDAAGLERLRVDAAAAKKEVAEERKALAADRRELAAVAGKARGDPLAVISARIEELESLGEAERGMAAAAAEAERAKRDAERERERLLAREAEEHARVSSLPVAALVSRAKGLLAAKAPGVQAAAGAADVAEVCGKLADAAGFRASAVADGEAALLAEAESAAGDLVASPGTLAGLEDVVVQARLDARARSAEAETVAASLRERTANRDMLAGEVADLRRRAERFDALAKELRADRIIAFLQQEALVLLAAAASLHLATLSGERYRLEFMEDEFFVVDVWNGEETRRARTLSGGETFLASLALALALSEEVRSLSVKEKARLDSLFLDEGFGTLDDDTLEVVVDAIEQLGGDGRMVGVITHVKELAVRMPVRIEVEKSPRGSVLAVRT